MPLSVDWTGVFPAVPTQFNEDFSLNLDATRSLHPSRGPPA